MHSEQPKEDELRMVYIKIKGKIYAYRVLVISIKERDYLEDLDLLIDGRIILKSTLRTKASVV